MLDIGSYPHPYPRPPTEGGATRSKPLGRLRQVLGAIGDRLYASEDANAQRHGWQITTTHAGLGRIYKDRRFAYLAACLACSGNGHIGPNARGCTSCNGNGRIWLTPGTTRRAAS
jgi:hypothetical protein